MKKRKGFAVSVIGAGHIQERKVCQDFSLCLLLDHIAIAVVCDGHSPALRGDIGARLAAETTAELIVRFTDANAKSHVYDRLDTRAEETLRNLAGAIIAEWNSRVREHHRTNPFTGDELAILSPELRDVIQNGDQEETLLPLIKKLYGTTLLAAVVADTYWFALRNGDSNSASVYVSLDGIECRDDIPWNDRNVFNYTTSVGSASAIDEFRFHTSTKTIPDAVVLTSDGVLWSLGSEINYHAFITDTLLPDILLRNAEAARQSLADYLPILSEKGNQDDLSIAVICNSDFPLTKLRKEELSELPETNVAETESRMIKQVVEMNDNGNT